MSNVDVFTIGLDQIHDLQEHGRILPFMDEVLWNSWLIVDSWASFGKGCGYVDTFTCLGVKHAFDLVAQLQDFNMGMIDRGVSGHGRHYEIWHVVDDSDVEWYPPALNMDSYEGEGWYTVSYSDGGQDYTNDGPVWVEDALSFAELMAGAMESATDTHLPYAEYHGDYVDDIDPEPVDWFGEMGDTLGDYPDEYTRALAEMF